VGTLAIGRPGAENAAVLAAQILGTTDARVRESVRKWRSTRTEAVLDNPDPRLPPT
jgi:5-(carboxyamino)imidazole ribonucleotide mutase